MPTVLHYNASGLTAKRKLQKAAFTRLVNGQLARVQREMRAALRQIPTLTKGEIQVLRRGIYRCGVVRKQKSIENKVDVMQAHDRVVQEIKTRHKRWWHLFKK